MQKDFDYDNVPANFLHCTLSQCVRANDCLRHQLMHHATPNRGIIHIINPARVQGDGAKCPDFYADRKVRFAMGITHLFDDLPYSKGKSIKSELLGYFKKTNYYRIRNKERLISPNDQRFIHRLFREYGIEQEPQFDRYVEEYEW